MTLAEDFERGVLAHLGRLDNAADVKLARIAIHQPSDVRWVLFEYDASRFATIFAVWVIPMLEDGAAKGGNSSRSNRLFDDGNVVVPPALYGDPRFEDEEPWDTAAALFERWLVERWKMTPRERVPAFVGHHDSFFKTNLLDGSRISTDQILEAMRR